MYVLLLPLGYCKYVGTCLPISIIVLKISVVHRECQHSGVMVEPKIIISTLNPLNLFRSELGQPGEIVLKKLNLPDKYKTIFQYYFVLFLFFLIPRFWQTMS